jgi:hypothetical protein
LLTPSSPVISTLGAKSNYDIICSFIYRQEVFYSLLITLRCPVRGAGRFI